MQLKKHTGKSDLQSIPGVGPNIEKDLMDMEITGVDDLIGKKPEALYHRLCKLKNSKLDRCELYVFRCAVYYAENKKHDPDLLKWWNWKDK